MHASGGHRKMKRRLPTRLPSCPDGYCGEEAIFRAVSTALKTELLRLMVGDWQAEPLDLLAGANEEADQRRSGASVGDGRTEAEPWWGRDRWGGEEEEESRRVMGRCRASRDRCRWGEDPRAWLCLCSGVASGEERDRIRACGEEEPRSVSVWTSVRAWRVERKGNRACRGGSVWQEI
jgi:hypothetical protein